MHSLNRTCCLALVAALVPNLASADDTPALPTTATACLAAKTAGTEVGDRCGAELPASISSIEELPAAQSTDVLLLRFKRGDTVISLSDAGFSAGANQVFLNSSDGKKVGVDLRADQLTQNVLRVSLRADGLRAMKYQAPLTIEAQPMGASFQFHLRWESRIEVLTCIPADPTPFGPGVPALPVLAVGNESGLPESDCLPLYAAGQIPQRQVPFAGADNLIIVRFRRDGVFMTPAQIGFKENDVAVTVTGPGSSKPLEVKVDSGSLHRPFLRIPFYAASLFSSVAHGSDMNITLKTKESQSNVTFRWRRPWSFYGINDATYGAWLPIGLFSTNLAIGDEGMQLASLPIGFAWGFKRNFGNGHYVGASVMANWLIHQQVDGAGKPTGDLNLAALTAGGLLDVNNWFYLGYAYGVNLAKKVPESRMPGHMLVIGVAPGALQFLKAQSP